MSLCTCLREEEAVSALFKLLKENRVRTVFQPVVDLFGAQIWGYEALSRGIPPIEGADVLFYLAERQEKTWDLECLCRERVMETIESDYRLEGKRLFINVTPSIFLDDRFPESFNYLTVEAVGLNPSSVVIELTERYEISDYGLLTRRVEEIKEQGFQIAIDDLGAGHSGLVMLASCIPDYIKLDIGLVRNIHEEPRKQHIIRSLVGLGAQVESRIIAEGVECWEELETLMRLGIRFVQGFLFARPSPDLVGVDNIKRERIKEIWCSLQGQEGDSLEGLLSVTTRARTADKSSSCREIWNLMKNSPDLDHLVVLDGKTPIGLITRNDFTSRMGGAFGFHLYQNRPIENVSKKDFLSVSHSCSVRFLSKLALKRLPDSIYDPVVVLDARGNYMGTVTMKQIIARSGELEIKRALTRNPLSGLPGNQEIQNWIFSVQKDDLHYSLIYADLDRFKEYNDTYGFVEGDSLIKLTASVLQKGLQELGDRVLVGHIGGDDFIGIISGALPEDFLNSICEEFDRRKMSHFKKKHIEAGFYRSEDRDGKICEVPLVTLSLAVIDSSSLGEGIHPAKLAEIAASLKHVVKQKTMRSKRSGWLKERRRYFNLSHKEVS